MIFSQSLIICAIYFIFYILFDLPLINFGSNIYFSGPFVSWLNNSIVLVEVGAISYFTFLLSCIIVPLGRFIIYVVIHFAITTAILNWHLESKSSQRVTKFVSLISTSIIVTFLLLQNYFYYSDNYKQEKMYFQAFKDWEFYIEEINRQRNLAN